MGRLAGVAGATALAAMAAGAASAATMVVTADRMLDVRPASTSKSPWSS
jgi:hypothetical protein